MENNINRKKRPFPTQQRLRELLERKYDQDGKLYFVAKMKRGIAENVINVGDFLYGTPTIKHKDKSSEHVRFQLTLDGYTQNIAVWNYIYEYGDYDRLNFPENVVIYDSLKNYKNQFPDVEITIE